MSGRRTVSPTRLPPTTRASAGWPRSARPRRRPTPSSRSPTTSWPAARSAPTARAAIVTRSSATSISRIWPLRIRPAATRSSRGGAAIAAGHRLPDRLRRVRSSLIVESGGSPVSVGRKTRAIPPAIARALRSRDHGCRFPGCGSTRFVDAHHVKHWAAGGETSLDNLVRLCRHHHRLVHEGGFGVEMVAGRPRFTTPDGERIPDAPKLGPSKRGSGPAPVAAEVGARNRPRER